MKKIVILSLVVLLSACGKPASTTGEATITVSSTKPAAESIASSVAAEESAMASSTVETSGDVALTAFLDTSVEHVKLSAKDLYPSGTVSMYVNPTGYSDTQYPYVKKTNETWKNMLKKYRMHLNRQYLPTAIWALSRKISLYIPLPWMMTIKRLFHCTGMDMSRRSMGMVISIFIPLIPMRIF